MAGLTDAKVRNAKPRAERYKIADSNGLYLDVRPNGNKSWLMRVVIDGKRTWRGIGRYPIFSLDDARAYVIDFKRGAIGLADKTSHSATFRAVAEEVCAKAEGTMAQKSVKDMYSRLEMHVYPFIGARLISTITTKDIYAIVERLEAMGSAPTANRVLQLCSRIFRHAILKEHCANDPCYALRGTIKQNPAEHRAALTDRDEIGQLMRDIASFDSLIPRLLTMMTAYSLCRPNEVRLAEWIEFDMEKKLWLIPSSKMKMRRDHMVPLTHQMLDILYQLRGITGHRRYVFASFASNGADRALNKNTALSVLRRLGYAPEEMTAHGFRGMASTILNEQGYDRDWIEMQLAHTPRDHVRSAYNRAQYWDSRCEMLQWYDDHLDGLRDDVQPCAR